MVFGVPAALWASITAVTRTTPDRGFALVALAVAIVEAVALTVILGVEYFKSS